jgi:hypothetical protein
MGERPGNRFHTRYDAGRVGDQNLLLHLKINVKVSSHLAWKADWFVYDSLCWAGKFDEDIRIGRQPLKNCNCGT